MDDVGTPEEARAAIARLKGEKQELAAQKKELAAEKAEENARWRERQAGRMPGCRGGGFMASMVRNKRRGERMEHADAVNRIGAQQAALDEQMRNLDTEIRDLEAFIREQGPAPKAPPAPKAAKGSPAERMQALTALRDAGLITDEEYQAKRAEILASL